MEPLHVASYPARPLPNRSVLALSTISKVIVITVKPELKVLITSSLTSSDQRTLHINCWQFVVMVQETVIKQGSGQRLEPKCVSKCDFLGFPSRKEDSFNFTLVLFNPIRCSFIILSEKPLR